jgi:hypothetical protein
MQEGLAKFDEGRLWLGGKVFGFLVSGGDMPGFVKTIAGHVVALGAEKVDDADLVALQQLMQGSFPLCAFAFSKMYGPRFAAVVNGDGVTQPAVFGAMDQFQQINLRMMGLGGRLSLKLFGKSVLGLDASAATGSMILLAPTTERAGVLRQWVSSKPLHSDTITNQMKERFARWQFWAKAIFGMIEYKPHQLRQEVIVLDAETGQATSTASPRLGFEFGFALSDVVCQPAELVALPAPARPDTSGTGDEERLGEVAAPRPASGAVAPGMVSCGNSKCGRSIPTNEERCPYCRGPGPQYGARRSCGGLLAGPRGAVAQSRGPHTQPGMVRCGNSRCGRLISARETRCPHCRGPGPSFSSRLSCALTLRWLR